MFGRHEEKSFKAVALAFIVIGAIVFAFGAVAWLVNAISSNVTYFFPASKVIAGLVIMALGYIQLELELLRHK